MTAHTLHSKVLFTGDQPIGRLATTMANADDNDGITMQLSYDVYDRDLRVVHTTPLYDRTIDRLELAEHIAEFCTITDYYGNDRAEFNELMRMVQLYPKWTKRHTRFRSRI